MANTPPMTATLSARIIGELQEAVAALALALPCPGLIALNRIDDAAHSAELDAAARPVDPRRLH